MAAPQNILDLGCGQGVCSEKLGLQDFNYTGVDASTFLLERAKALYPQANKRFVAGNAYELPFREASFDAVFSIALWHLLEDKAKAARELSRVLAQGGDFMIVAANPDFYEEWTKNYARSHRDGARFEGFTKLADGMESKDVLYLHSYDEIVESLRHAGLEVKESAAFRTALSIQGTKV